MRRRRRAFTLIELVASAVLAAMMMIALVNVIWSAARDTRQLRDEQLTRASVTLLIDRLAPICTTPAASVSMRAGLPCTALSVKTPPHLDQLCCWRPCATNRSASVNTRLCCADTAKAAARPASRFGLAAVG